MDEEKDISQVENTTSINIDLLDDDNDNDIDIDIDNDNENESNENIVSEIPDELKNSLEVPIPEETPNESIEIQNEDANTTNCLALTIQKEHKLTAIKNVFLHSIRMSWKVAISTITLALIKMFS